MWTRRQYMDNECSHEQYYNQYLSTELMLVDAVQATMGSKIDQTEGNMAQIPLKDWDRSVRKLISMHGSQNVDMGAFVNYAIAHKQGLDAIRQILRPYGEIPTMAVLTCMLKKAGEQIFNQQGEQS